MNLKKYILKHKLTVPDFARLLGVAYGTAWRWFCSGKQKRVPSIEYAKLITKKTNHEVRIEDLYV